MFCRNCGKELSSSETVCSACGAPAGNGLRFCRACGREVSNQATFCPNCGAQLEQPAQQYQNVQYQNSTYQQNTYQNDPYQQNTYQNTQYQQNPQFRQGQPVPPDYERKSKLAAGLLGIFVGSLGIHRFYLGYTAIGVVQLILTLCTCGASSLWGFIEGILILAGSGITTDANGVSLKD